jgi:Big-like domain-containing protein
VNPVNDGPTAVGQYVSTNEDVPLDIALSATDPEGMPLTFTVVGNPSHGALSGVLPNLTYTPAPNYFGPDSFTFKVNDGTEDSTLASVNLTVENVNDAPEATGDAYSTVEDTLLTIALPGIW